jgi:hypothetical protein
MSISDSNICIKCNETDTIDHYLFSCRQIRDFWIEVEAWWNNNSDCEVTITIKHILLGFFYDLKYFSSINYVVLLGKFYIYRQKMNDGTICLRNFLSLLKYKLDIEKTICQNSDHPHTLLHFNTKWSTIYEAL